MKQLICFCNVLITNLFEDAELTFKVLAHTVLFEYRVLTYYLDRAHEVKFEVFCLLDDTKRAGSNGLHELVPFVDVVDPLERLHFLVVEELMVHKWQIDNIVVLFSLLVVDLIILFEIKRGHLRLQVQAKALGARGRGPARHVLASSRVLCRLSS